VPQRRGVLAARHISKSYGEVVVLDELSLVLAPGSRVGVVGPNGIGKSTLLRVLAGIEAPDMGRVSREPDALTIGYLAQGVREGPGSPGQQARAAIEQLWSGQPDVVLLDEPTNDLDLAGLRRLDELVRAHRGSLLAASHDRVFLEQMDAILELEAETRRVRSYRGGYSTFDAERRRAAERHERAYGNFAAERERVETHARRLAQWQQRGYGQGRKKKKGRDLAKTIERRRDRLREVDRPWSPWRLALALDQTHRGGDVAVALDAAVVRRGEFVLGPLDLEVRNGERVAVLGANGTGKSTLVKMLLGELPLEAGRRRVGPSTVLASLPQGAGPFCTELSLLEAFLSRSELPVQQARSLLAKFNLPAESVRRPASSLSPGERSRAMLALLAATGANALILDEPTNNLDIEAIEQLEQALGDYEGAVVLVTHDRRFLQELAATRTIELTRPA
jgi:ATPase subunit of ABC transporter with duplicated ATPase domains